MERLLEGAYEHALKAASELSLGHTRELVRVKQAMCLLTDGQTDGLIDHLRELAPSALAAGLGLAVPFCHLLEAWTFVQLGDLDSAETALECAGDITAFAVDPQLPSIVETIAERMAEDVKHRPYMRYYAVAAELWARQENDENANRCRALMDSMVESPIGD